MLHVGTTVMNTSWLGAGTFNRLNSGGDVTALTLYNTGTGGLNSSTSLAFGMGAGLGPTARITDNNPRFSHEKMVAGDS